MKLVSKAKIFYYDLILLRIKFNTYFKAEHLLYNICYNYTPSKIKCYFFSISDNSILCFSVNLKHFSCFTNECFSGFIQIVIISATVFDVYYPHLEENIL